MGDRRRQRLGLRWKFNLTLLPAVAMTVLLLAWVDTAHERQAVSAAHGQHAPAAGAPAEPGPVDPTASPAAAVRRSAVIHAVYAIALLSLIAIGLNTALSRKLPRQADSSQGDSPALVGLGRNVRGGTRPRLSWGRSWL